MEAHLRVLDNYKIQIEKGLRNYKKSPKERLSQPYLEARLEILEKQFSEFTKKHEELISEYSEDELQSTHYFENDVFDIVTDLYLNYKVELRKALPNFKLGKDKENSASPSHSNNSCLAKLPKITIPVFSGKYHEWSTFRDLFVSLIHNNQNLDDVQRLHYLRSQLLGEAEQLIRHIPITELNYEKCWNLLQSRYNNKRFMANCILKRLLSQRNMIVESSTALKELLDTTTDCLHELTNIDINVDTWDVIIIYLISSKLDAETRKQWELHVSQSVESLPTFKSFQEFLEARFRALEFVEPKGSTSKPKINTKAVHVVSKTTCPHCSDDHLLCHCRKFAREDVDQRRQIVRSLRLCFNCLRGNHTVLNCRAQTKCRLCNKSHHSLLHPKIVNEEQSSTLVANTRNQNEAPHVIKSTQNEISQDSRITTHFATNNNSQVLLATALIKAESRNGNTQVLRALLDQGSQASFITEAAVQLLQLKKTAVKAAITGLGGSHSDVTSKHMVRIKIQSHRDPSFNLQVKAYVLGKVTSILPERKFTLQDWSDLKQVELADPLFNKPNKIDILLGSEVYGKILKEGLIKDPTGNTIAQNTSFGWIISGEVGNNPVMPSCHHVILSMHTQVQENELLKRFWELEAEPHPERTLLTPEEQACENHFEATTVRDETGRYIVELPFKSDNLPCNTKQVAVKRLEGLERKLSRNTELKQQYSAVIDEYLTLGHLEEITNEADINKVDSIYLPHHAVIREDKTTTKVRVVFDASSKGGNGVSLNETLMVGPQLQAELRHTVMRWRRHPVCLAADVVKMYRQVKVATKHTDFQRILWRKSLESNIQEYRLLRVTFGTSCAPYLAVKTLHQIAKDEGLNYPLAADIVINDFYMDDLMTGCQTLSEAVKIYEELNGLLNSAGFTLQKWTSNRTELLTQIQQNTGRNLDLNEDQITKILGLTWNRSVDEFCYTVRLPSTNSSTFVTKREIISEISRLYDPLGWIAPCIITAKVFIQKLWMAGLDWDDELPPSLLKEWQSYRSELQTLINFSIPRWIHSAKDDHIIQLHGFSDASNVAYAAVIYIRIIDYQGNIHSNLVTAKTKVAPIKQVSIPRLELCGAVLVTKLLLEVAKVLQIPKSHLHAWTDSTVVLAWLSDHPSRWNTFVANRTSQILSALDAAQWHYVRSPDNPADGASRGLTPSALLENSLWKNGPSWLLEEQIEYVRPKSILTKLEQRSVKVHVVDFEDNPMEQMWSKFSSLKRLVRVIAFCRRFLRLREPKDTRIKSPSYLTASEIRDAMQCCLRQCQKIWFGSEIDAIRQGRDCSRSSGLISLNPFLDENDIMRVGGRIQNSTLAEQMKHPVIVPHQSHLAKIIVADAHERILHGGLQLTLNFLRFKYWITKAKNLVRFHIHNCVPCIRHAAITKTQLMGQLPSCRVTPSKPFLQSGVDYAGPIQMRSTKGRGHKSYKGYICLFVCMATRAVHIEAVSDLTSQGFLFAFKRFVARRGHCQHIWSDNGTNFVGASRELKAMFRDERAGFLQEIAAALANNGTEWHFIPPHAPNFGGLWESGIKSTKHHLKRVIGETTLTFEEMSTFLCQIEACLNSRPLSEISVDSNDPIPLTPGHFLVGQPLVTAPDYNYEYTAMSSLRRWQLTQRMTQSFWRRWSLEYLTTFFQRHKWNKRVRDLKIGDVVLVKEDNLPPARWLYGRVVELHPGKDGLIRVVTLQCKDSRIKRPTSKLCVLPVSDEF